ncbi:MAG: 4Fe-4S binding protein [Hyphomicrobiaceae bacterium]|nr:4Fe-4S binding protein [Hyphomicrobiaceae bacterium]
MIGKGGKPDAGAAAGQPAVSRPLPTIDGETCVHGHLATASCRACVAACPRGALALDLKALSIDTDACDGCGLCRPACPQSSIDLARLADSPIVDVGTGTVLLACERAEAGSGRGVVPCVDAFGERDLQRFAGAGVTTVLVARGDCRACPRGRSATLGEAVRRFNAVQPVRGGAKPLQLDAVSGDLWRRRAEQATQARNDFDQRRRSLFGLRARGVARIVSSGDAPAVEPRDVRFRYVPEIDPQSCHGCDACVRACPHCAIAMVRQGGALGYTISPQRCTGCRLCIDVCDVDAVGLAEIAPLDAPFVALAEAKCRRCGVVFHVPQQSGPGGEHVALPEACGICRLTQRTRLLFQVRND